MKNKNLKPLLIVLAFVSVYLFWGGTYLALRLGIETIPPFILLSTRFLISGGILFLYCFTQEFNIPRFSEWKSAFLIGILLLMGGNGFVTLAEQSVPSGISALVVSTIPICIYLFELFLKPKKKFNFQLILGLVLGLIGLIILIYPSLSITKNHPFDFIGYIFLISAAISWSLGTVLLSKIKITISKIYFSSLQMLTGGLLLGLFSFIFDEWTTFDGNSVSNISLFALFYLIVFGSILGFTAYNWLITNSNPSKVSSYAYVNPVIAIFLGWYFVDEPIEIHTILSTIIIGFSVYLIITYKDQSINS